MQIRTRKWLAVGIGVKRYLLVILGGTVVLALALAMLLAYLYRTFDVPESAGPVVYTLTLQFIPHPWREVGLGLVGLVVMVGATLALFRSVLSVVIRPGEDVAEILYQGRKLRRGPRIVGIGGGTGMAVLLRGLKGLTANLTAVVTVADDGGSSGRLRRELGLVAPGDIRNCLTALADAESLMTRLVDYRFEQGTDIKGHSLGNLLLAAIQDIEGGLDQGIEALSRVLKIRGSIAPSTMSNVNVAAELEDGRLIVGESEIRGSGRIRRVFLTPRNYKVNDDAVASILGADLVVIGPGSLYTSILPNLLVNEIAAAVRATRALKLYVCNVATEPGETDDFSVADHVEAIENHVGPGLFRHVLVNSRVDLSFDDGPRPQLLHVSYGERQALREKEVDVVVADVIDEDFPEHHDSARLAKMVMDFYKAAGASSQVIELARKRST